MALIVVMRLYQIFNLQTIMSELTLIKDPKGLDQFWGQPVGSDRWEPLVDGKMSSFKNYSTLYILRFYKIFTLTTPDLELTRIKGHRGLTHFRVYWTLLIPFLLWFKHGLCVILSPKRVSLLVIFEFSDCYGAFFV